MGSLRRVRHPGRRRAGNESRAWRRLPVARRRNRVAHSEIDLARRGLRNRRRRPVKKSRLDALWNLRAVLRNKGFAVRTAIRNRQWLAARDFLRLARRAMRAAAGAWTGALLHLRAGEALIGRAVFDDLSGERTRPRQARRARENHGAQSHANRKSRTPSFHNSGFPATDANAANALYFIASVGACAMCLRRLCS